MNLSNEQIGSQQNVKAGKSNRQQKIMEQETQPVFMTPEWAAKELKVIGSWDDLIVKQH